MELFDIFYSVWSNGKDYFRDQDNDLILEWLFFEGRVEVRVQIDGNIEVQRLYQVEIAHGFFGAARFKSPKYILNAPSILTSA